MDFLETTIRRNPKLIESARELHQEGAIPPNTYVVDLDTVRRNSDAIVRSARSAGIKNYFMTKQFGRNPLTSKVIVDSGIQSAVAIDIEETKSLHRNGFRIGHVGHLVQIPKREIDFVVAKIRPEIITVYSYSKAQEVNSAAKKTGITQRVMLRPIGPMDSFSPSSESGVSVDDLINFVLKISDLENIRLAGLTSFPSFRYDLKLGRIRRTANFETLLKCKKLIEDRTSERIEQINAPGSSCASGMKILAEEGATHGEPGHAFMGTTPWHAFQDLEEIPAWIYVTEVSHISGNRAFTYSGGLPQSGYHGFFTPHYHQNFLYAELTHGAKTQTTLAEPPPLTFDVQASPDYYTAVRIPEGSTVESGDTVMFGFRPQVYVSRSRIAIVRGIGTGRQEVMGIFDRNGNLLEDDDGPAPREKLQGLIEAT